MNVYKRVTLMDKKESRKIKRLVFWYNMVPNLFWSGLNLIPISIFCYSLMDPVLFYTFLSLGFLTVFLPNPFFDQIRIGKTTSTYSKIGVSFINKFIQNGDIVNRLIRKRIPHYKVIPTGPRSVDNRLKQTYMYEKFHFMMFLFFGLTTMYALIKGHFMWACIIILTNFLYNVYPIFLQQYIRIRLTRLKQNTWQ